MPRKTLEVGSTMPHVQSALISPSPLIPTPATPASPAHPSATPPSRKHPSPKMPKEKPKDRPGKGRQGWGWGPPLRKGNAFGAESAPGKNGKEQPPNPIQFPGFCCPSHPTALHRIPSMADPPSPISPRLCLKCPNIGGIQYTFSIFHSAWQMGCVTSRHTWISIANIHVEDTIFSSNILFGRMESEWGKESRMHRECQESCSWWRAGWCAFLATPKHSNTHHQRINWWKGMAAQIPRPKVLKYPKKTHTDCTPCTHPLPRNGG